MVPDELLRVERRLMAEHGLPVEILQRQTGAFTLVVRGSLGHAAPVEAAARRALVGVSEWRSVYDDELRELFCYFQQAAVTSSR